ncbi:MAG: DUF2333 family protein [Deltaproteobacteria bacterium]
MNYKQFLTVRIIGGTLLFVFVLWGLWAFLGAFKKPEGLPDAHIEEGRPAHGIEAPDAGGDHHVAHEPPAFDHGEPAEHRVPAEHHAGTEHDDFLAGDSQAGHGSPAEHGASTKHAPVAEHGVSPEHGAAPEHGLLHEPKAKGVHFVEAMISVLDYELNERFWGWRANDVIRITDNVENMQLGMLEVVRRASVNLAERISRHGVSAAIDKDLENAMNWFMIKPDEFWLPSAEEKYKDSLEALRTYADRLERGEAHFYVRADSLIPLLLSFADLAGSCDENLVKKHEADGSPVSWFKADDYFYYAKGVAQALAKILHAVMEDFSEVIHSRQGHDLLHHAIHACEVGGDLEPWIVTDAALDGVLANHRANMAAEISHARYFLNALATALST